MPGSYRELDYRIRPAKHAERLMMAETLGRLSSFDDIQNYQYLGLGSVYFSDFLLFHRMLGIRDMVNIEACFWDKQRFHDNVPLRMRQEFGSMSEYWPSIDLSRRTIAWLDYDGRLDKDKLNDLSYFSEHCSSGSLIAISVQCKPELKGITGRSAIEDLAVSLGRENVNPTYFDKDLVGEGTANVFREALMTQLIQSLSVRNSFIADQSEKLEANQVFNFRYKDGAEMLTIGWVISKIADRETFDNCRFGLLASYRNDAKPFKIKIPKLTSREVHYLLAQMPTNAPTPLTHGSIPERDATQFRELYRYLPQFVTMDWL